MKYTNKNNIPDILVKWLEFDEYDYEPGVFSATSIMRPLRATVLMGRHYDSLEIDVADRIASRYGTALHESFEKVPLENCVQEERLYAELDGFKISGKPDILRYNPDTGEHHLMDIKSTSAWTIVNYKDKERDHTLQLSIYRWLAIKNGKKVSRDAEIIFLFTDWSKTKAKEGGDYPKLRCMIKDIRLMDTDEIEEYMSERLLAINHLTNNPDLELPRCNREELWQKDDKWAVMKFGRKSALKLYDIESEAMDRVLKEGENNHYVEHRPGKINRCDYCDARAKCKQYKEHLANGLCEE